ncbi:Calmodulin-like protein 8 [Striga hermonthica]|uniref:Calmodulin-like protein 8 n=1 Tax=Striga hermonthica TaxID=68872 RepID=A0A9N7MXT2_STRHE|nr:Calmodulin-like protein 8 [Striga hermonthica]
MAADTMTQEQPTTEFREAFFGVITVEELASVIQFLNGDPTNEVQFLNGDPTNEEVLLDDDEADGDHGSTHVDFIEFLDIMSRKMEENVAEELKEAFKVFDRDQDGFISAIELRNVMLNLGERLSDEEAEQMIKEADFDGDGLVSFEEFARMMI